MNLPATIAAELRRQIVEGDLGPGARLPGHRALASLYDVSVGSVREAISMLVSAGLVETRAGRGTFVAARGEGSRPAMVLHPGAASPGAVLERKEVEELVEAREVIEVQLAGMAAERCTPEDAARLRESVGRMADAAANPLSYAEADVEFHVALAEVAANRYLLGAMLDIRSLLRHDMELGAEAVIRRFGDLGPSVESHRALVQAIAARNVDRARDIATQIVRRNRDFVLGLYALVSPAAVGEAPVATTRAPL